MAVVTEEKFRSALQSKVGDLWEGVFAVFTNFGPNLSFDVTNVMLYAVEQGKVPEVLGVLEEHYEKVLQFQHPTVRGRVHNGFLKSNPTEVMFLHICSRILGLQPNSP